MTRILLTGFAIMVTAPLGIAADSEGTLEVIDLTSPEHVSTGLADFQWKNRLLVVMADTGNDPKFVEQLELLAEQTDELVERDIVLLTDSDPMAASEFRQSLRPRGFAIVLIAKDGQVRLRKPFPWSVREISRAIDKSPERQREVRQGN